MLRLNAKGNNYSDPECAILFKVYVPIELGNIYFMNIDDPIRQPNVLIIKLLTNAKQQELTNEVNIHSNLGSQSTILPFCPSYIFSEEIKSEGRQMTNLGEAFYGLLQTNYKITESIDTEQDIISYIYKYIKRLNNEEIKLIKITLQELYDVFYEIIDHVEKNSPLDIFRVKQIISKIYALIQGFSRQTIIIMEFLECSTLGEFHKLEIETTEHPTHYNLYNTTLESLNLDEVYTFCTYFLASLMVIEGYTHGDLHSSNIMICKTTETSIVPYLIDFGRSTLLSNLKFHELESLNEYWPTYYIDYVESLSVQMRDFINTIYFTAFAKNRANMINLDTDISTKIAENKYVEAVILISMCRDITTANSWSMFYETFNPSFYKDNEPVSINYLYLYKITKQQAEKYNALIGKIIGARKTQQQTLDGKILSAQSVISETGVESKSKRSIYDLLSTPVSDLFRSKKSTAPNTSNSKPPPRVVGGRHILNFIKNKSKKIKKKTRRKKTRRKKTRTKK